MVFIIRAADEIQYTQYRGEWHSPDSLVLLPCRHEAPAAASVKNDNCTSECPRGTSGQHHDELCSPHSVTSDDLPAFHDTNVHTQTNIHTYVGTSDWQVPNYISKPSQISQAKNIWVTDQNLCEIPNGSDINFTVFKQTAMPFSIMVSSVLWRCWLGSRKSIRPVKNWVMGCWVKVLICI